MRINLKLLLALSSCLFFLLPQSYGQEVEPDALHRADAIQKALSQNKMILLIVSDTNNCTGCITLEFSTLPSTNKPTMRQFLGESFIYWACGPEQSCTEFRTYTGPGVVGLPQYFVIDPAHPENYFPGLGDADPIVFHTWARVALLKMTKAVVSTPGANEIFSDKNIVAQGRSISTNVPIIGVYHRLNGGTWTYAKSSDGLNWQAPLDAAQVANSNVLEVYALDSNLNRSQTNAVNFSYSIAKTPANVALGSLSQIYDGSAKPATATTTPAGLTVNFTYNGSANAPVNAGSYTVVGMINDPTYQGSATGTLVIGKATATVNFGSLSYVYDGTAKTAAATTTPPGLAVTFTYDGLASAPVNAGSYTVVGTVNDSNYQGSATGTLVISPPAPAPVITSLEPSLAAPGGAIFFLYVNGTDFQTNAVIRWNGIDQVTKFVSANRLRATIEENLIAAPGTVPITVVNPGGVSSIGSLTFTVGLPTVAPVLTQLDPSQVKPEGNPDATPLSLFVNGSDFLTNAVIRWNGTNQVTRFISSNRLRATIEQPLIANPGTAAITVFNPGLDGGAASATSLTLTIADTVTTPKMTIGLSNSTITIDWPTNGFKLQSSPVLPATNWQDVAGSETTKLWSVTIGTNNQFYRLKQ